MNKQEIQKAINHLTMLRRLDSGEKKSIYDVAISALTQQLNNGWIPVSSGLFPETNKTVQITMKRNDTVKPSIVTNAVYIPPRTIKAEDFMEWESDAVDYEDETDIYWTLSGWYEEYNATGIDYSGMYLNDEFDVLAWREQTEPYTETQKEAPHDRSN